MNRFRGVFCAFSLLPAACSTSAGGGEGESLVKNPTGTCVAPDSGARAGYSAIDPSELAWLPDCRNTLLREYWRVFAKRDGTSAALPRPDGAPELQAVCASANDPLRPLVDEYALCSPATDAATVDRVNSMDPADALTITHYMHTQLVFELGGGVSNGVRPFPIPSDVVDACALHAAALSPELSADCDAVRRAIAMGLDPPTFTATGAELARLLNELYGIGECVAPEFAARVCVECGPVGGCSKSEIRCTRACSTATDCAGSAAGELCDGTMCVTAFGCI